MPKPKRRGKKRLPANPTEQRTEELPDVAVEIIQTVTVLFREMPRPHGHSNHIMTNLSKLSELLDVVDTLEWNVGFAELVEGLKRFVLMETYYVRDLVSERTAEQRARVLNKEPESYQYNCDTNCRLIKRMAFAIIEKLTKVFSEKAVPNYFLCLLSKNSSDSYALLSVIREYDSRFSFAQVDYNFKKMLNLTNVLIRRCKATLFAETKMSPSRRVPFTSFAAEVGALVEDAMNQVFYILETSDIYRPPEGQRYDVIATFDLLTTIAEVAPFHRLNPTAFNKLYMFAITELETKPSAIPRDYLARILIVLLSTDLSILDLTTEPLYSLPKIGKYGVNLVISQSMNYLLYWIINSHDNMRSRQFACRTSMAGLEMKIITTFVRNHYTEMKSASLYCMRLAVNVLEVGLSLEAELLKSMKQNKVSKEDTKRILDNALEPSIQAIIYIQHLIFSIQEALAGGNPKEGELVEEGNENDINADEDDIEEDSDDDQEYLQEFAEIFHEFLNQTIALMSSPCDLIAEAVVECIAAIGEPVYNALDARHQRFCVVSILGYARDSRVSIRTRSGRCVAHFLEFSELVKNYDLFLLDAFDLIELNITEGTSIQNYSAFAWAMGNLTTTLAKHFVGVSPGGVGFNFMIRMYNIGVLLAESETKSRYNGHRALGGLLLWTPVEFMDTPQFKAMLHNSIIILGKQVGKGNDFKARWNACYSLGSILQNKTLVEKFDLAVIDPVRETLVRGFFRTENFKEKTNCIKALCYFNKRSHYGDEFHFHQILEMFFKCLDFPETKVPCAFKLVNKFVDDVGLGVIHFLSLITDADNVLLECLIYENSEKLRKVVERAAVDPERAWIIKKAENNIRSLTYSQNDTGTPSMLRKAFRISEECS